MNPPKVPLTTPYLDETAAEKIDKVLKSGWLTQGLLVTQFEGEVAQYAGIRHAVAFSSCTAALHVALLLSGVGPGDEVIVPSYTWIATPNVAQMVGATPVFADIDVSTFNVCADSIEAAITPLTKAVMPVHQFGLPADLEPIEDLARHYDLALVEDAACALGSRYKDKAVGSSGNLACFSFHPRKVITTGEGGMLLVDDDALAKRARMLLNHGASVSDRAKHKAGTVEALMAEEFSQVGYNYRMTDLQGALGVAQMEALQHILDLRRRRAEAYNEAFSRIPFLIPPQVPDYAWHNWQTYALRVSDDAPFSRDALAEHLLDAGIACRPGYMACHVQPVYRAIYPDLSLPETEKALRSVIILPLYPQMTDEEFSHVVDTITAFS